MPIWNGFGVLANYTYTDASSSTDVPVPSSSKNIANISGYYENERFSARLSYNYRSKFFVDYDAERGYRQLWSDSIVAGRLGQRQPDRQHLAQPRRGEPHRREADRQLRQRQEPSGPYLQERPHGLRRRPLQVLASLPDFGARAEAPSFLPRSLHRRRHGPGSNS
jgi:hypothetical protein